MENCCNTNHHKEKYILEGSIIFQPNDSSIATMKENLGLRF